MGRKVFYFPEVLFHWCIWLNSSVQIFTTSRKKKNVINYYPKWLLASLIFTLWKAHGPPAFTLNKANWIGETFAWTTSTLNASSAALSVLCFKEIISIASSRWKESFLLCALDACEFFSCKGRFAVLRACKDSARWIGLPAHRHWLERNQTLFP